MKANLDLDEEQFKIAAVEEKKRRRESRPELSFCIVSFVSDG
jgi:hypothetical protein